MPYSFLMEWVNAKISWPNRSSFCWFSAIVNCYGCWPSVVPRPLSTTSSAVP